MTAQAECENDKKNKEPGEWTSFVQQSLHRASDHMENTIRHLQGSSSSTIERTNLCSCHYFHGFIVFEYSLHQYNFRIIKKKSLRHIIGSSSLACILIKRKPALASALLE